jgi:sarcosine oxidase subunit beta
MVETADVVIIGGGVIGTSAAYNLAQKGSGKVLVLEKTGLASGATGQAAGLVRHHYTNRELVELALYSSKKLEVFEEEMGQEIGYVQNGLLLMLADDPESLADTIEMQRDVGVELGVLEAQEMKNFHPKGEMNMQGVGVGLYDKKAAYADPYKVTVGYANKARELGAQVRNGVLVTDIKVENGKVTKVITNKGEIATNLVLNIAGPWASRINEMVDVKNVPVGLMTLQHALTYPDGDYEPMTPTIIDNSIPGNLYFVRPESGGTVLIGMDKDDPNKKVDPDNYYFDPPFNTLADLFGLIIGRMPFVKNYRFQNAFGAPDAVMPDWNPAFGCPNGAPEGYFCALGFSGHGFKLAPAFGEMIAQMVRGEETKFDTGIFEIDRFEKGLALGSQQNVMG